MPLFFLRRVVLLPLERLERLELQVRLVSFRFRPYIGFIKLSLLLQVLLWRAGRRLSYEDLCACGHWSACADRALGVRDDGGCHDSS